MLEDVIDAVEEYISSHSLPQVIYNIETKSTPMSDDKYHPKPQEYVDLLVEVLKQKNILDRVTIQSFDPRTLWVAQKDYPEITLVFLIADNPDFYGVINMLGFIPAVYSPNFFLVNEELIEYAKKHKMKVIPWTVNDKGSMIKLLDLGVDGIITDYPDRLTQVLELRSKY